MWPNVMNERFNSSFNQETVVASNLYHGLLVIEESLSYWLAGLQYSLFAYMTFIWVYPVIQ